MKKFFVFSFVLVIILIIISAVMAFNMRFPVRHLETVRQHAGDFDVALILAVIKTESGFREEVKSHAGAQGLMQIIPTTAEDIAKHMGMADFKPEDVWKPEINIAMGCFYLNRLKNIYGSTDLAIIAYNAGQGRVNGWLADGTISADKLDGIPFTETSNYLERVRRNERIYRIILTVTGRAK